MYMIFTPPTLLTSVFTVGLWTSSLTNMHWLALIFFAAVILSLLDLKAQAEEARRLSALFIKGKPSDEAVKLAYKMRRSWCGRGTALAVSRHMGGDDTISAMYFGLGYRWWHIFPDGAPGCFLKLKFWRRVVCS